MGDVGAHVMRGSTIESVHRISAAVASPDGALVRTFGDPGQVTFLRSAAKPIQGLAVVESGAADHFGFTARDLAIVAASHSGEPEHVERTQSILDRIGLPSTALQCGRHPPYHEARANEIGDRYTSLHHNCSGKHAGMLATCVHKGWDVQTYLEPGHPLQTLILRNVAEECGVPVERIVTATDGCGAPTFALPIANAARAFARFTGAQGLGGDRGRALLRLRDAMVSHPSLVAGSGRLDTKLMTALPGRVWVKAGAEAFYGAGILRGPLGIALKVEDGGSRAVGPVLSRLLGLLGEDVTRPRSDGEGTHQEPRGPDRRRDQGFVLARRRPREEMSLPGVKRARAATCATSGGSMRKRSSHARRRIDDFQGGTLPY